ncbi:MAG: metallopeptidase TldD-related protein, partial [Gammaproteobacteria bacterium]|nr:metallopeptidase TldD-related protein [Gammaproteobacteria bacterium]
GNGAMQRDHWYTISREPTYLEAPKHVGRMAAKRALSRLNAQQLKTGKYPVLFSPDMASGLIGHLIAGLSGASIYRKSSFLLDALETKIFPSWMHIYEQPHIVGAFGSVPFDSEGVQTSSRSIVAEGTLLSYVLDSYSARKLNMKTTGNSGGVHNLCVEAGKNNFNAMLKEMDKGLFVTELMGQGVNTVTGDYSRGASGFWVENGKIQYPVEEITIAGNLKNMFQKIVSVGNDVDLRRNTRTGSILIDEMMIAGN